MLHKTIFLFLAIVETIYGAILAEIHHLSSPFDFGMQVLFCQQVYDYHVIVRRQCPQRLF